MSVSELIERLQIAQRAGVTVVWCQDSNDGRTEPAFRVVEGELVLGSDHDLTPYDDDDGSV